MKLIPVSQLQEKGVRDFLKNVPQIQYRSLIRSGFILEVNSKIRGCFNLEKVTGDIYELRQIYVITTDDIEIPLLFEMIIALAKEFGAKEIWVNSHKLMVDILLEKLKFYPQKSKEHVKSSGKWWSYTISE